MIMFYNNIKFTGVSHHVIKTNNGRKLYLEDPTTLQVYDECNNIVTLVTHVEALDLREERDGVMVLFVCNDDLADYLAFTRVYIPRHSTMCTIRPYEEE